MKKYKTLLFDIDDTLFDFSIDQKIAFKKAMHNIGYECTDEMYKVYNEINLSMWRMLDEGKISLKELYIKRFELFFERYKINESPKKFNKAVSKHLNVDIPRDWNGVAFEDNSPTSQNLSNSPQLQQQVVSLYRNGKFLSDKIPIELNQDKNLHYSVGHGTIIRPNVDKNGYFKGTLFDWYDFDCLPIDRQNLQTNIINDAAFILQKIKMLKNYYILIPIKFKWE